MKVSGFLFLFPLATISIYVEKKKQTTKKKSKGGLLLIDWTGAFWAVSGFGCSRFFSSLLFFLDSWSQERFETVDMFTADR